MAIAGSQKPFPHGLTDCLFTGWSTAGKAGVRKKSWNLWSIVCVATSGFPVKLNSASVPQKLRKPCESSPPFYTFLKQVELDLCNNKQITSTSVFVLFSVADPGLELRRRGGGGGLF